MFMFLLVILLVSVLCPITSLADEGTKKWEFPTGGSVFSSPAVGPDGTIYVGSDDGKLYAINPDGTQKWVFTEIGNKVSSSPAIGSDGTIYVGLDNGEVHAIDSETGKKKEEGEWPFEIETGGKVSSSPAVGSDGTVYVGFGDHRLYAIKSNGEEKWHSDDLGDKISSSPAIGSDGTIYVGSDDFNVYAIDSKTGKKKEGWSFKTEGKVSSSPTIGFGGIIYVGSEDKKLYAIESSSTRLADRYWPMLHHDVRHTGRNYANQEPTSDAGEDQTVKAGDTVTLNGSNSSDPDYGIPLYEWTQTDEGTSVTLSDATAVKPTFTAP
ncbi:MAG: hypothetical protein BA865_12325, partial [Desulfobacterales bacterium S5133MH4]